ncbi:methyltransferase [Lithospermum erythrorhizon]|uniref:Methyltransferase n=1 Tax=Lithospermum erythrorhizon TaxID=34254 RepID=A0AAV3QQ72_LITER
MKGKDGKPAYHPNRGSRVRMLLLFFVSCGLSFYLGKLFCSEKDCYETAETNTITAIDKPTRHKFPKPMDGETSQDKAISFPECGIEFQDYTPCTDPKKFKHYSKHRLSFFERHCPPIYERKECLIPPPEGYKVPIRWPQSKNECWYRNVPYDWINKEKSNQHWLIKEGEKFHFPGGGTMFPDGVSKYVDQMVDLIPQMKDGTIRTAIDTGCGVASWGGDLLDRGILTISLAPRDNHEAQVQFALERGIPAILGIISTQRLPFPSNSFDMAHCSRCLIPWTEFGGIYLLEIHRILRPGGFWVLSGPPVNYQRRWKGWETTIEEQKENFEKLEELLTSMCFKLYNMKDDIAVWQKTSSNACYKTLDNPDTYPPKCDDGTEPDSAWYTPIRPCVVVPTPNLEKIALPTLKKWPERLNVASVRINQILRGSEGAFNYDSTQWKMRVKHYKTLIPALGSHEVRNVMDMNTVYGGFAAALSSDPLWVMNVVSSYAPNTLPVVYDRGLVGTYHDWCEAFSTYPRTYDLLHLDELFSSESHRCEMKHVFLEMDRILRPNGYAIIREDNYFAHDIATLAKRVRWNCRKEDAESGSEKEKIFVCQKKLWFAKI